MLYNIQILRAVAALLVVHAHAAGPAGLRLQWDGGGHGVDLFFVISGFIISYAGSQDTDRFLLRRIIRVVPIYWTSTLVLYGLVLVVPDIFRTTSSDPELLMRSLLFVPSSNVHTSDGIPHPTLAGGWTLNYEMYFYVLFSLALLLSRRLATALAGGALLMVVGVVAATGAGTSPIAHFYGHPIVFEFLLGMIVFHLVRAVEDSPWWKRLGRPMHVVLAVTILAGLTCLAVSELLFGEAPRWIVGGLPAFAVVLSAVLLERAYDIKIANRIAVLIGDASYVLYLIQAYVLYGVIRIVLGSPRLSEVEGQVLSLALMGLCIPPAVLIYRYYEQPILRWLKVRLVRRRRPSDQRQVREHPASAG